MRPSTRDIGLRLMGVLEVLFEDPRMPFSRFPPAVVLTMTYSCSKVSEGTFTFSLGAVERGDQFLVPVGHKVVDLRVEADGRVAIGFATNVRAVVEASIPSLQHDAVSYYLPSHIEPMAQDIMLHLCSSTT